MKRTGWLGAWDRSVFFYRRVLGLVRHLRMVPIDRQL